MWRFGKVAPVGRTKIADMHASRRDGMTANAATAPKTKIF